MSDQFVLETQGLVKEFKGFVAVDDVNLKVNRGHIHALIGPNGAGKTTLFNIVLGLSEPDNGEIEMERDLRIGYSPRKVPLPAMKPSPNSPLRLRRKSLRFIKRFASSLIQILLNASPPLSVSSNSTAIHWKPEPSEFSLGSPSVLKTATCQPVS